MGRKTRLRQAKKNSKHMTVLRKSASTELFGSMEYPAVAVLPYEDEEEVVNRNILPSPPLFNGTKYDLWSCRMNVYLRLVDTHVDISVEARDALALLLIQQALDESLLHKIALAKTSQEAMNILRRDFSERGSSEDKTSESVKEKHEGSVSHTDHSESHSPVKLVDEDDDAEDSEATASPAVCMENPTMLLADEVIVDDAEATQEVAGQPLRAETEIDNEAANTALLDKEKLMQSLPRRAIDFTNKVFDCADFNSYQPVAEVENPNEEDDAIIEQFLINVNSLSEAENDEADEESHCADTQLNVDDDKFIVEFDKLVEECTEGAEIEDIKMDDEPDVEHKDEKPAETIFHKWSQEEIKYYYQLMWQQATAEDESAMRAENSMREHADLKIEFEAQAVMGTTQLKDEEPWHDAIPAFEDEDGRTQLKELEDLQKKKVKMKKQLRKIREF